MGHRRARPRGAPGAVARVARWALVTAVAAIAAPAAASQAAPSSPPPAGAGSIGLTLLAQDAAPDPDPRGQVYIVDHLARGGILHRRVEVANSTAGPAHVALYSAAATIERGTFVGAAGRSRNDLSTWTSVLPAAVDVVAGGRAFVDVGIRVAPDAAPGEHYGVIWAEVRSAASDGGVVEVSRVGIRIYLSVGPGGAPAASFTVGSLRGVRSATGEQSVTASVHNTGGRALDMVGTLQLLAGPGGVRAGPFPVTLGTTVAVGGSQPVTVALAGQLPPGPWTAQLVLRSGLLERRVQGPITFPEPAQPTTVDGSSGATGWLVAGLVGLAVLLGLAAVLALRRRRHRARPDPAWVGINV
ncbi:MAG: hypothetical protein ABI775_04325 [Pseudonocardiales bacterium]